MTELAAVAVPFVEIAHGIVWASVATAGRDGRPRSRVLHPYWEFDGDTLVGWIATMATPLKRAHLEQSPNVSVTYWAPTHDTVTADCRATWHFDLPTRERVWNLFQTTPEPLGYDPRIIPGWTAPSDDAFCVLRLDPYRLRVLSGAAMKSGGGPLRWSAA